jgi:hemoglobin-like flavoprotein
MIIRRHPLSPSSTAPGLKPDIELAERLQRSAGRCGPLGGRLVERFYERLFQRAPALRPMFPADLGKQREKLGLTLERVVGHLRSPDDLSAELRALGQRHLEYGAKPEHYPVVIGELVGAMVDVGAGTFTEEDAADWSLALRIVAEHMLGEPLP